MRLATIETWAGPRAALLKDNFFVDLHASDARLPSSVRELLEGGPALLQAALRSSERVDIIQYEASKVKFHAPVHNPHKIICLGLNYRDHAAEANVPIPSEPIVFSKYATSLIGHGAAIALPPVSQEVDYEAELVIVIGKKGKNIPAAQAMDHVAGYTIGNDVSARDWQLKKDGKQWLLGKTFDTFAPMGPMLVTADEVPQPQNLPIRLRLNGQTMQDSNTGQMIFGVAETVAYISQVFTLEAGDLIFTGTPPGVGCVRNPPVFLKGGDVVEVEIEGLSVLKNDVIQGL
jgi:2-keto-4-pentenoate hydratase/2-oxohepta-3-ene-1,7-dioic acid hydratase in catechol pathway